MKKLATKILSLVVLATLAIPNTIAKAAPPPETSEVIMTEDELASHNLSLGTISWNDDIYSGSIVVTYGPTDGTYSVKTEQFYKLNDMAGAFGNTAKAKKEFAKNAARTAFKDVRSYAQTKGWWDCKWKIKKTSKTKVTATATVEFKSVTMDRNSQSITIKQTTQKKNGKWKTTYTVGGKKISVENLKKLFT